VARIRTIKPEFWSDEKLAQCSRDARLLFMALLNHAEDHGVARANLSLIKSQVFPYDDVSPTKVGRWLGELETKNLVKRFGHDGQTFLFVTNFAKHQKIDRPGKTTLPNPPPEFIEENKKSSTKARRTLDERSLLERRGEERKGEERRGEEEAPDQPPESLRLLWNECKAPEQPEWVEMNKKRQEAAAARLRERPLRGERSWEEVFRRLAKSSFARGLVPGKDGKTWVAGPVFFLRPDAAARVLEGAYDDRGAKPKAKNNNALFQDYEPEDLANAG
jgi:hypothetical protein